MNTQPNVSILASPTDQKGHAELNDGGAQPAAIGEIGRRAQPQPEYGLIMIKANKWLVSACGDTKPLNLCLGVHHVATIVRRPYHRLLPLYLVHALEAARIKVRWSISQDSSRLVTGDDAVLVGSGGSRQPRSDLQALKAYHRKLEDLDSEIEHIKKLGGVEARERLERDKMWLVRELGMAKTPDGQFRDLLKGPVEFARLSVRNNLDRAYKRIAELGPFHQIMARHLKEAIKYKDGFFAYRPAAPAPLWSVSLADSDITERH